MTSVKVVLEECERRLRACGIYDAKAEAGRIMCQVASIRSDQIDDLSGLELRAEFRESFERAIQHRERRVPIERIFGVATFCGITLQIAKDVFRPFPETERLVGCALDVLLQHIGRPIRILDLGTGSGCILLSLLRSLPLATGIGIDIDENAVNIARLNALRNDLYRRADFVRGNWSECIEEKFDVLVSNPPRTASSSLRYLPPEIAHHEPRAAMDGGDDGLTFFLLLARDFARLAKEGAYGIFQVDPRLAGQVEATFRVNASYSDIRRVPVHDPVAVVVTN